MLCSCMRSKLRIYVVFNLQHEPCGKRWCWEICSFTGEIIFCDLLSYTPKDGIMK